MMAEATCSLRLALIVSKYEDASASLREQVRDRSTWIEVLCRNSDVMPVVVCNKQITAGLFMFMVILCHL